MTACDQGKITNVAILCTVIVLACGMIIAPIVVYHSPEAVDLSDNGNGSQISRNGTTRKNTCFPETYKGRVCRQSLQLLQSQLCPTVIFSGIQIPSRAAQSQKALEDLATQLLNGLKLISNPECELAATPFLCFYIFGLCDSTGNLFLPSSEQCEQITSDVCSQEWATAMAVLGSEQLPTCESLPEDHELQQCSGNTSNFNGNEEGSGSGSFFGTVVDPNVNVTTNFTLVCHEDFFLDEGRVVCKPECGKWEHYPHHTTLITKAINITCAAIGFMASIAVLVLSCTRYKQMLKYPSVMVFYQSITLLVLGVFVLLGFCFPTQLFCSSADFLESVQNPTVYCSLTGVVLHYVLLQISFWVLFQVVAIFWGLKFPFHARTFKKMNRFRYIHIGMVIAGVSLPCVPVVAGLATGGFELIGFPTILCVSKSKDALFYSLILPINIVSVVIIVLMLLLLHVIVKERGVCSKDAKKRKSPVQIKVLFLVCYYITIILLTIIYVTITARDTARYTAAITEYFLCESTTDDRVCSRKQLEQFNYPGLATLAYSLISLYPTVNLIYAVDIQDLENILLQKREKVSK